MDTNHHHHAATASQTQQQTLPSSSLSSSGISSPFLTSIPSTGAVPTTTAGPITISLVVALTLVICMILNCGKLKRRVNSQRYNCNVQQTQQHTKHQHQNQHQHQQGLQETVIVDEKIYQENTRPLPNKDGSPWSSSSTLLTPHAPAYMPPPRQVIQTPNSIPPRVVSHPRR